MIYGTVGDDSKTVADIVGSLRANIIVFCSSYGPPRSSNQGLGCCLYGLEQDLSLGVELRFWARVVHRVEQVA